MIAKTKCLLIALSKENGYILPFGEDIQSCKVLKIDDIETLIDNVKETMKR